MARTFNCGIGAALVVSKDLAEQILRDIKQHKEEAWVIGKVVACPEGNHSLIRCSWVYNQKYNSAPPPKLCPPFSPAIAGAAVTGPRPSWYHHISPHLGPRALTPLCGSPCAQLHPTASGMSKYPLEGQKREQF